MKPVPGAKKTEDRWFRGISLIECMIWREPCDNQIDANNYDNSYVLCKIWQTRFTLGGIKEVLLVLRIDEVEYLSHEGRREFIIINDLKRTSSSYQGTAMLIGGHFLYFLGSQGLGAELQAKGKERIQDIKAHCLMGKPSLPGFVLSMEKRKRWRRKHVSWPPSRLRSQRVCVQWYPSS